mmetsp:Transcript_9021/g.29858  ORF Transcript_9021/g.29858 Transcript_9021/m.29858 type:complete len:238 (-) Transcript_9021:226-939(-)
MASSRRAARVMAYSALSGLSSSTKSSMVTTARSPAMEACAVKCDEYPPWNNAARGPRSAAGAPPPPAAGGKKRQPATHKAAPPSMWTAEHVTWVGRRWSNARSERRMLYQAMSPRAPVGSMAGSVRMSPAIPPPRCIGAMNALCTAHTSPKAALSAMRAATWRERAWCRNIVQSMSCTPAARQAATISRRSPSLTAVGFSISTCFPWAAALRTHSLRIAVGRGMSTACTSGSSSSAW